MGIWDDLKAVALAVHRLTEAEKKLAGQAAEAKSSLKEMRAQIQDLRERRIRIEARLDGLDETVSVKAQAHAAIAVSGALAQITDRLARLEGGAPDAGSGGQARLPPAERP